MSSPNIVRDIRALIKTRLMPSVPKRWIHQFDFGIKAFSLRSFSSANGNARMVVANPHTASTKTDRLLANLKLARQLGSIFDTLRLVHASSFVNIDHSDMNGLMALGGSSLWPEKRLQPVHCADMTIRYSSMASHFVSSAAANQGAVSHGIF